MYRIQDFETKAATACRTFAYNTRSRSDVLSLDNTLHAPLSIYTMAEVLSPQNDRQSAFYSADPSPSPYFMHQSSPNLATHNSSTSLSSRTSTSNLSNLLSTTPPSSVGSSLEDKYRQELDSEDDYPHFDTYDAQYVEHEEPEEQESTISEASLPTPTIVDDTAVIQSLHNMLTI